MAVVVIDNGADMCRVGFTGEDVPRATYRTVVATSKNYDDTHQENASTHMHYVGSDALAMKHDMRITYPIPFNIISDFEAMEQIWGHGFSEQLNIKSDEHAVLLSEPSFNAKACRENTLQMMFETFNVPAVCIVSQEVLALLSTGRTTGVVLQCGKYVPTMVPVYEGYRLTYAMGKSDYAGQNLSAHLIELLRAKGCQFPFSEHRDVIEDIKKSMCYVNVDYNDRTGKEESVSETTYHLPNGTELPLGSERYMCPEALFHPNLMSHEMPGLHESLNNAITKCSEDLRSQLYRNIVLAGGSTLFSGFKERLAKEMTSLAPDHRIEVMTSADGINATWNGGSLIGGLPSFRDMCISKEEYDETGPVLAHWKFF